MLPKTGSHNNMKLARLLIVPGLLFILSIGCNLPAMVAPTETPTSPIPTFEPSPTLTVTLTHPASLETEVVQTPAIQSSPTSGPTPIPTQNALQPSPTTQQPEQENEAILILEPGRGRSHESSHVAGEADSVFDKPWSQTCLMTGLYWL
jgi:hypothetical protein